MNIFKVIRLAILFRFVNLADKSATFGMIFYTYTENARSFMFCLTLEVTDVKNHFFLFFCFVYAPNEVKKSRPLQKT